MLSLTLPRVCVPMIAVLALAIGRPVRAQLAIDRSEIFMRPNVAAERVGVMTVTNTSDRVVQAIVKVEDWDRSEDGANRWFPAGTLPTSCSKLLTVFPSTVSLDAGASQSIRLVVADSAANRAGECWSAVMVETVQAPTQRGGVRYLIRSAVKVYVEPTGLPANGEVTDMRALKNTTGADSLEVWFRNAGARHYVARGTVEFRRTDNTVAATLDLPDYYVLPGAHQRARVAIPTLPVGEYVVLSMVDYGGGDIAAMQIEYVVHAPAVVRRGR